MTTLFWDHLHGQLEREIAHADAVVGVCVRDLVDGRTIGINAGEIFPTASTIKIHILATLLLLAEQGEIDLSQRLRFDPAASTGGSGILAFLEDGVELTLLDTAVLMIALSDNTATNTCIDAVGMERVKALLNELELSETRLRRKMMDAQSVQADRENVSTPAELVELMTLLYAGRPTPWVAERTLDLLRKPKYGFIDQAMPLGTRVANKPGSVDGVRCDAGIVYLPRRPYAVAIMAKYGDGARFEQDVFAVRLAETIYKRMTALDQSNRHGHRAFTAVDSSA